MSRGLGDVYKRQILYGSQVFNLDLVITGVMILCAVAVLMYYIILYIEKKLVKTNY